MGLSKWHFDAEVEEINFLLITWVVRFGHVEKRLLLTELIRFDFVVPNKKECRK